MLGSADLFSILYQEDGRVLRSVFIHSFLWRTLHYTLLPLFISETVLHFPSSISSFPPIPPHIDSNQPPSNHPKKTTNPPKTQATKTTSHPPNQHGESFKNVLIGNRGLRKGRVGEGRGVHRLRGVEGDRGVHRRRCCLVGLLGDVSFVYLFFFFCHVSLLALGVFLHMIRICFGFSFDFWHGVGRDGMLIHISLLFIANPLVMPTPRMATGPIPTGNVAPRQGGLFGEFSPSPSLLYHVSFFTFRSVYFDCLFFTSISSGFRAERVRCYFLSYSFAFRLLYESIASFVE